MSIIGIDFDGTCVTHAYPKIGDDIGAIPVLKELISNGHQLILFTMRSNGIKVDGVWKPHKTLSDAINWFNDNSIPLYGIQCNPSQYTWTSSPKAYCDYYIDDAAIGCPLKIDLTLSEREFVDWEKMRNNLIQLNLITL